MVVLQFYKDLFDRDDDNPVLCDALSALNIDANRSARGTGDTSATRSA